MISIAAYSAHPWRRLPEKRPKTEVNAAGITRISSIWKKFESPVGFSNGIELFTLKNPPPLVPSILMTSWEATGPSARVWLPASV